MTILIRDVGGWGVLEPMPAVTGLTINRQPMYLVSQGTGPNRNPRQAWRVMHTPQPCVRGLCYPNDWHCLKVSQTTPTTSKEHQMLHRKSVNAFLHFGILLYVTLIGTLEVFKFTTVSKRFFIFVTQSKTTIFHVNYCQSLFFITISSPAII